MTKEKLQVYIDIEHRDALEELKTYLPVEETINDSALMRFIIIDLLNRIRKEELFEKKILDSLSVLTVMTNAKLEQDHTQIPDLFSSNVYQEAVSMSKKTVRNENYRFKNKKKIRLIKKQKATISYKKIQKKDSVSTKLLLNTFQKTISVRVFFLKEKVILKVVMK